MEGIDPLEIQFASVNRAFSKQSLNYDADDKANCILLDMRQQVYNHVAKFIRDKSRILELNSGTGIDALHFAQQGHTVHATDISDGMIASIKNKIELYQLKKQFTCQQLSFEKLDQLGQRKFDYVFSNFGGLNCTNDLSKVTTSLPKLLTAEAYVTFVIMPPICPWELLSLLKGNSKQAFRRFHRNGVMAHVEGEYFKTYYHSLSSIKKSFGSTFKFLAAEGLCALSPPPSKVDFPSDHPLLYKSLRGLDAAVRSGFPFNRCADHIIVTFQYQPA